MDAGWEVEGTSFVLLHSFLSIALSHLFLSCFRYPVGGHCLAEVSSLCFKEIAASRCEPEYVAILCRIRRHRCVPAQKLLSFTCANGDLTILFSELI
jgi:hypothetical protein